MSKVSRAVILFTGNPRAEEAQKRLPSRFLSTLHAHLETTVRGLASVDLIVAADDSDGFRIDAPGATHRPQAVSLAAKVESAVALAFNSGYESVVLLAGDILGLRGDTLERTFELLEAGSDVCVLGPSGDGGFYLAGFNSLPRLDWTSIPWCSPDTALALCAYAVEAGVIVRIIERLDDVDTLAEAIRLVTSLGIRFARLRRELQSLLAARRAAWSGSIPRPGIQLRRTPQLRAPPAA